MFERRIFRDGYIVKSKVIVWQLFFGFFIGLILGAILGTFLFLKNIDIYNVRERQEYLIREVKELRKEREAINYIFKERGLIKEHNEKAVTKPREEGK